MFFTQKLSLKFRPGLTKERVDLHEIEHYRSNVYMKTFTELRVATIPIPTIYSETKTTFAPRSKKRKFRAPPFFSKLIGNNHVPMMASWRAPPSPR